MGSGETAPTMIKPHRAVFDRLGDGPIDAVMLETPFSFQENRRELVERTLQYFDQTIGHEVRASGLGRSDTGDTVAVERAVAAIRGADWVFAGPGSPSFTLRQWHGTAVPAALAEKLETGGAVVFSSAAALTLGVKTVPVYEVYKVGADPFWLDGLDLLSAFDLPVSVIPHYDNNEGQTHDTSKCYLGETRLARIEPELPEGTFILGIDEHTGVVLDLDHDRAEVFGKGVLTLRCDGESVEIPAGETVPIDVLRAAGRSSGATPLGDAPAGVTEPSAPDPSAPDPVAPDGSGDGEASTLGAVVRNLESAFDASLAAGDADGCVRATLDLEQAILDWSADTGLNADMRQARTALRSMIVRLGTAATDGLRDPRDVIAPVVGVVLALRTAVREEKRYDLSDLLRDELAAIGIEVRDTPDGVEWVLHDAAD